MPEFKNTSGLYKTIPWKLIAIFILFSAAIVLLGIYYYNTQKNRIFKEQENSLSAIASLKIDQIELWHSERLADAKVIRDNIPLIRSIKKFLYSNDNQSRNELSTWMRSVCNGYDYSNVLLIDTLLKVRLTVLQSDEVAGDTIEKILRDGLHRHNIIMTDLHKSDNVPGVHIGLIIPLVDNMSKEQLNVGWVILRIDPNKILFPLVQSWPTLSKSSETLIIRREGDSVLFLNELRHRKNTALNFSLTATNKSLPASKAVDGVIGLVEGLDYRNIPVVAWLADVPGFPWKMVAKVDKEEIEAPLKRFSVYIVIITILLILINASFFGLWIWNQRVKFYKTQRENDLRLLQADIALRESEVKFRQTFDLSPIGIVMVGLDKKFLRCNKSFAQSLGYKQDELIGSTIDDITFPDDREIGSSEMMGILKGEIETSNVQKRYLRPDGQIVWGEVLISLIKDRKGHPEYFLAIIQDITDRIEADAELRLQSEIMSHLAEAVYLVRIKDGIIMYANSQFEKLFGYGQGEMLNKNVSIVNAPSIKSPDDTANEIIATLSEQGFWKGEVNNIRKDGTTFWSYASVTIFEHSKFGTVLVSVHSDITERKRAEEEIRQLNADLEDRVVQRTQQLEAANKELEAFSYSVSHDLRAPLRSVHGFTKILLEDYEKDLDDEGKRICGIISSSATQMGELIDDLLSFSRIGRSSLNPSLIDMKLLAASIIEGMTLPADKEKIKLNISKLDKAYGDVTLIGQVWTNLISNAIKYSSKKENPVICIDSGISDGMITYSIKDNGVGFDMQYSHKLFGVFQRLHSESEFEGNGVGLAIVQRIVLRHGGKVWAEGEIGKGSTFYFSLPLQSETGK